MYPDAFRLLVENIPSITPEDVREYAKRICGIFAHFKANFDADNFLCVYMNSTTMRLTKASLRQVIDELQSKY